MVLQEVKWLIFSHFFVRRRRKCSKTQYKPANIDVKSSETLQFARFPWTFQLQYVISSMHRRPETPQADDVAQAVNILFEEVFFFDFRHTIAFVSSGNTCSISSMCLAAERKNTSMSSK